MRHGWFFGTHVTLIPSNSSHFTGSRSEKIHSNTEQMELSVSQISGFLVKTKAAEDCGVVFGVEKSSEQFFRAKSRQHSPTALQGGVPQNLELAHNVTQFLLLNFALLTQMCKMQKKKSFWTLQDKTL